MKLKIITYATHKEGYYNILIKQFKKQNVEYKVIGMNKKWKGFFQRYIEIYDYLKTQDDNLIILVMDAFDSLLLDTDTNILNKYKNMKKKIIYGIEDLQNNLKYVLQKIVFNGSEYTLNGGSYIGKNKYLKKMMKTLIETYGCDYSLDDQIIINKFVSDNKLFYNKYMGLDVNCEIFANMSNTNSFYYLLNISQSNYVIDYVKNKIVNTINNISPSIISGCSNFNLNNYVIFLGYDTSLIIKRKKYKYFILKSIYEYIRTHIHIK